MTDRELAYKILYDIHIDNELCHKALKKHLDACDKLGTQINKAFITRIVNGVTERYLTFVWMEQVQAGRPVSKIKPALRIIIAMGLYQGYYMSVPVSAACNESVKLAKAHGLSGLSGFVNGVLRSIFREYESIDSFLEKNTKTQNETKCLEVRYSCPKWIIEKFIGQFGRDKTVEILKSSFEERKTTVYKVNKTVTNEELENSFKNDNVSYRKCEQADDAYELDPRGSVAGLEGFTKGWILIQDISSMLASQLIPATSNARVLDLCAAPGGKAIHLASLIEKDGGVVFARDISKEKVRLIEENCKRLGIKNVAAAVSDASVYCRDDSGKYDIVVADLPCSGLGVIGRKPDIKYKTKPEDIKALAELQRKILDNAMDYVKEKGYLAYSTCTLTSEENQENAEYILKKGGFEPVDITNSLDKTMQNYLQSKGYMQIIPNGIHDGFFIALFRKSSK